MDYLETFEVHNFILKKYEDFVYSITNKTFPFRELMYHPKGKLTTCSKELDVFKEKLPKINNISYEELKLLSKEELCLFYVSLVAVFTGMAVFSGEMLTLDKIENVQNSTKELLKGS